MSRALSGSTKAASVDPGHDMDEKTMFRLFDIYRDAGGNFLDTARVLPRRPGF